MKRLKDIDFEENARWMDQFTDNERTRFQLIYKKYIKWKYPHQTLHKDWEEDMFKVFIDGLLVGILDI